MGILDSAANLSGRVPGYQRLPIGSGLRPLPVPTVGQILGQRQAAPSALNADLDGNGIPDIIDQRRAQAEGLLSTDRIYDDPRFGRADAALQALMASGGPLSEEVQNMIAGRLSDSTAAAANTNRTLLEEQLARTGGNLNDPSVQAQMRAIDSARMGQNATGRRDVAIQAAMENFGAQRDLAGQTAQLGATMAGLANPLAMQNAANILNYTDSNLDQQTGTGTPAMAPQMPQPTYRPTATQMPQPVNFSRPAPAAAPAPTPAPAAMPTPARSGVGGSAGVSVGAGGGTGVSVGAGAGIGGGIGSAQPATTGVKFTNEDALAEANRIRATSFRNRRL